MKRLLLLCASVLLVTTQCSAQTFWRQTNGPQDDVINALVMDSAGTLYAAGSVGFSSTDDGVSWTRTGFNYFSAALAAESGSSLYSYSSSSPSRLHRSTNQGKVWNELRVGIATSNVKTFALAAKPGLLFMSEDGHVLRYAHATRSWDSIPVRTDASRTSPENLVSQFVVAPDGSVFALTAAGIFHTRDDGGSWSATEPIAGNRAVRSIHVDATGLLYAATDDTLFSSTNAGTTWSSTSLSVRGRLRVTIGSKGTDHVFVGSADGLFARSTDRGLTWIRNEASGMYPRTILATRTGTLLIGSDYGGVFRSTDDGATWSASNRGMATANAKVIAAAPNGTVYVVGNTSLGGSGDALESSASIWSTTDAGASWRTQRLGALGTCASYSLVALANNDVILGAGCGAMYRTTDNGATWTTTAGPSQVISIVTLSNGDLLAAVAYGLGLYRSSDNGASWSPASNFAEHINTMLAHSSGRVIAGTRDGSFFISTDAGFTWSPAANSPGGQLVSMTEGRDGRVYAASQRSGVFHSTDGGETWAKSGSGLVNSGGNDATILADRAGHVYLVGYNTQVQRSTDLGSTWHSFSSGLTNATTMGIARDSSGHLWVGGASAGVFRSTVATASIFNDITQGATRSLRVDLAPNPLHGSATFSLTLRSPADVRLRVYDATGSVVATVVDCTMDAGAHQVRWNSDAIPAGVYVYVLTADGAVASGSFVVAH